MPTASFDEYPYVVIVDGSAYRVNALLPEGVDSALYEDGWAMAPGGWDDNSFDLCIRCTEATQPGSTRDMCMQADAGAMLLRVKREDFFTFPE